MYLWVHGYKVQVQNRIIPSVEAARVDFLWNALLLGRPQIRYFPPARRTNEPNGRRIRRLARFRLVFYCENAGYARTNSFMPHGSSSCRRRVSTLLRSELESLYARRSALNATIQALECYQAGITTVDHPLYKGSLEISPKPCNLTTCRNA